ncbi:MAG: hypothetical protein MUF42_10375 [Cytophagaceae bacterium]|jgi:hypothetical protein|nr:hypothetical protein [Cytophagaceae bacterium]
MKKVITVMLVFAMGTMMAGNNPTEPNSSYKNSYPKGSKASSKEIKKDQVERNYKKQGTLKLERAESSNIQKAGKTSSYKHPQGL